MLIIARNMPNKLQKCACITFCECIAIKTKTLVFLDVNKKEVKKFIHTMKLSQQLQNFLVIDVSESHSMKLSNIQLSMVADWKSYEKNPIHL